MNISNGGIQDVFKAISTLQLLSFRNSHVNNVPPRCIILALLVFSFDTDLKFIALIVLLISFGLVFAVLFSNRSDHICVTGPLELSLAAVLHFWFTWSALYPRGQFLVRACSLCTWPTWRSWLMSSG